MEPFESPRHIHVLVVDDEDSFRLSVEMALKMAGGFVVESCDSGESAIELLQKETFDIILLDHAMSGLSGIDVLRWMHKQGVQTPAIMITAAGSESLAVEAMKLGVFDYFRKDQLEIDKLSLEIRGLHERFLLRKKIHQQELQTNHLKEKQKELDALSELHDTVIPIGQLLERSLQELAKELHHHELKLVKLVKPEMHKQCKDVFAELRQRVDMIASGVGSMRNISTMVTRKFNEIRIAPANDGEEGKR